MDDDARLGGRRLALILGWTSLLLGIAALIRDLALGVGFGFGPVVPIAVGLAVILSSRNTASN